MSRFVHALWSLGFNAGDILFTFLLKTPEQFFSFLGAMDALLPEKVVAFVHLHKAR